MGHQKKEEYSRGGVGDVDAAPKQGGAGDLFVQCFGGGGGEEALCWGEGCSHQCLEGADSGRGITGKGKKFRC